MKRILLIIIVFFIDCSDHSSESGKLYKVSGIIYQNGQPSNSVKVSIDDKLNLSSTTNENGEFFIKDVPEGDRKLKTAKTYDDGSFVETTSTISVNDDIVLNSLILPNPTILKEINLKTENSLSLSWSPSNALDFREYKIYKHDTAGLDEETGTLAYVTIDRNDTTFVDENLNPLSTYFYRIFVMNEFGRLGGSNIVSATTNSMNIIENGGFEIINAGFAEGWSGSGILEIDQTESYSGNNSLHFYSIDNVYSESHIERIYSPQLLTPNSKYELTMWIKHDSLAPNHTGWFDIYPDQFHLHHIDGPRTLQDWTQHKEVFFTPPDINGEYYGFQFHFYQTTKEPMPEQLLNLWIDNIEVKRIE